MDLKQLEYFVAVVDLGGFSHASRLLRVAQPAISRQVRRLEVELRQNLLLRNRGAVPTRPASACSITPEASCCRSSGRDARSTRSRVRPSATSRSACRRRSRWC
jgi:hypothetical protein